jgi:raffinose/stachyose/melibiose transport system substrate-binding protein
VRKALPFTLCISMLVSACGSSNSHGTAAANHPATEEKKAQTVKMLTATGYYNDTYKKLQDKLKTEENIDLDIQVLPDDQYYKLVKVKIAAKEVPDILVIKAPAQYEEIDAPKNMISLSNEHWVSRLSYPETLKALDGNIYAWPRSYFGYYAAAYYSKKIFADLGLSEPKTYADFLRMLETIKSKGNGITPIYMSNKDLWTTQIFMTSGLPVLLGDKANETWNKLLKNQLKWTDVPEFKKILHMYLDLYKKDYVNNDHVNATFEDAKAALSAGKAAMLYNGEWTVGDLITKYGMKADDIGAFVIPFGDKDMLATGTYVTGWLIPKDAVNIEGAKKVLDILSQPSYMNIYFTEHPGSSGFKDVIGQEEAPAVKALEEKYMKGNKYTYEMDSPMSFVNELFSANLWGPYVDIAIGAKTPEQVIETWQVKYVDYMKRKRQPGF